MTRDREQYIERRRKYGRRRREIGQYKRTDGQERERKSRKVEIMEKSSREGERER